MKRNRFRRFFQQKQYAIASLILFAAIAAMTGVYVSNRITNEQQEEELAQKETELLESMESEQEQLAALDHDPDDLSMNETVDQDDPQNIPEEDVTSVTSIIQPETDTDADEDDSEDEKTDTKDDNDKSQITQGTSGQSKEQDGNDNTTSEKQNNIETIGQEQDTTTQGKAAEALHFSSKSDLAWPLQGDVILNYSMDQTVYFATLEQYKYNPALIIAGKVNEPVKAAATGRITDISTNEETGVTVTMDLGDGYSIIYGQLKEVLYKEGATVEVGNAIGYIAEPTKYYSVEGSNLYFELQKDQEPVNPMQYME